MSGEPYDDLEQPMSNRRAQATVIVNGRPCQTCDWALSKAFLKAVVS